MALNNPYARYFDGNDDYIQIPASALVFGSNPRTYSFSFRADETAGTAMHILAYGQGTTGRAFGLYLGTTGILYLNLFGGGDNFIQLFQSSWEGWVDLVYDGDIFEAYYNGEKVFSQRLDINTGESEYGRIGHRFYYAPDPAWYKGIFDEFRSFNYALSGEELASYRYRYLSGNEPGLLGLYRFDEGTGNIAIDSSPNANHGTIYGATWVDGAVDLISATGHEKIASATAYGAATASAKPIRGRGLRAAAHGMATVTARPYKIAIARAAAQGAATAKAVILVLTIPKGVYNIDADNIFNRNQPITPDSLANYIEVWVNPLKPVAEPEEVYKTDEEDPFLIGANETKTVTIHYKKEPVTEVDIEFVNAPPYATIDSIKHYAWGADVTVTSPEAGTFELVATGKPLEVQGRELVVREDETSILENGVKKYTFDNPFVQDRATAEMIAEKLLSFAIPQADIEIDWRGDPALALADSVLIPTFQRQGLDQRDIFYVTKQELKFDGGLRARLTGRKMGGGSENG